jgi:hypothetical protein
MEVVRPGGIAEADTDNPAVDIEVVVPTPVKTQLLVTMQRNKQNPNGLRDKPKAAAVRTDLAAGKELRLVAAGEE